MNLPANSAKPLLLVDVDGVISLFGFSSDERPPGVFLTVDGIPHLLSQRAGQHLRVLAPAFELVWCTGWEEKADEYLPLALGLPAGLPHLRFDGTPGQDRHWKLDAIDDLAGAERPVAWIDDDHRGCEDWADERPGATLLLTTAPEVGITDAHVQRLLDWARSVS
jgi:hypothetical protein